MLSMIETDVHVIILIVVLFDNDVYPVLYINCTTMLHIYPTNSNPFNCSILCKVSVQTIAKTSIQSSAKIFVQSSVVHANQNSACLLFC